MKSRYLIFLFLLWQVTLWGQINKYGIPFITNYTPTEYNAGEQNWAMVQDNRGIMYFGNNENGILEYDGVTWRQIQVSNNSSIRSLACDNNGIVYVGAIGEFGFLTPNKDGQLIYKSLINQLDSAEKQFNRIDKIYVINDYIYFINVYKVFCFKKKLLQHIYKRTTGFYGFNYQNNIYLGNWKEGLNVINDSSIVHAKGGDFYKQKNIFVFLPNAKVDKVLVGIVDANVESYFSFYSTKTGNVKPNIIDKKTDKIIKNALIYNGIYLQNNNYAIATINKGALILNENANIISLLNKKVGLQNETVTNVYSDKQNSNLWLSLDVGISKVKLNSPFRKFSDKNGLRGYILDITEFKDKLYVATSSGVYFLNYLNDLPIFKIVNNLEYQSWTFLKYKSKEGEKLLVGSNRGIYEIINNKAINIEQQCQNLPEDYKTYCYKLESSNFNSSLIFVGTKNGLAFLEYKNGKWNYIYQNDNYNYEIRSIQEDDNRNIWLGTSYNGIVKININGTDTIYEKYGTESGLSSLKNVQIYLLNHKLLFATQKGFFRYNEKNNKFYRDTFFPTKYSDGSIGIFRFSIDPENNYWISAFNEESGNKWVVQIVNKNGKLISDRKPFMILNNLQAEVIYHLKDSITWIGISNLVSFNRNFNNESQNEFNCLIRKVIFKEDSVVFKGAFYKENDDGERELSNHQIESLKPEFKHLNNAITFFYAAPFFENEKANQYSYRLEGYETQWSKWTDKAERGYTNLDKGKYVFLVKAKNVYDVESETASFEFTILPPWYQTIVAYITYVILAIFIVYIIVKLYTRRLEQEKIRLEGLVRERTAEVVAQKDEIELQRDQIAEQKKGMEDSIHYASRIQRALLPGDTLRANLHDHFILFKPRDIVSGDFYWMANIGMKTFVVAADCTGHGVPGAFMSMLGMSFLNEIVLKSDIVQVDEILNKLRESVITSLKQTGRIDEAKDGMDLAMYIWDRSNNTIEFSGANNPLYYVRKLTDEEKKMLEKEDESFVEKGGMQNGKYVLNQIKADKMPIGIYVKKDIPFTCKTLKVHRDYTLYTFSDGYVDQFGGDAGRKFMSKPFKKLLLDIQDKSMEEQREILDKNIENWKSGREQVDDILVIGIKI